jgi:hypothetical protein
MNSSPQSSLTHSSLLASNVSFPSPSLLERPSPIPSHSAFLRIRSNSVINFSCEHMRRSPLKVGKCARIITKATVPSGRTVGMRMYVSIRAGIGSMTA